MLEDFQMNFLCIYLDEGRGGGLHYCMYEGCPESLRTQYIL